MPRNPYSGLILVVDKNMPVIMMAGMFTDPKRIQPTSLRFDTD